MRNKPSEVQQIFHGCTNGQFYQRLPIHINKILSSLEGKWTGNTAAIPAMHSFTASDYTGSFHREWIMMPLKLLQDEDNGVEWIETFTEMAQLQDFSNHQNISSFVKLYMG